MKIKFLALLFALTTVVATAQNNSAKSTISANIQDQGLRGITDAKLIATLNAIVDWAGSPALKRLTIVQTRALSTDYPNIIYVTNGTTGLFTLDETDNTTADDGVNTLVTTANNKRYKRVTGSIASISGLQAALDLKIPYTGGRFFGDVTFSNNSSTSAYSSLGTTWSGTGNNATLRFNYQTKFGASTINWNPLRFDANGYIGVGIDPSYAFHVSGASQFNSAVTMGSTLGITGAITTNNYTGYPKANGASAWTASSTIPSSDVTGNFAAARVTGTNNQAGYFAAGVLTGNPKYLFDGTSLSVGGAAGLNNAGGENNHVIELINDNTLFNGWRSSTYGPIANLQGQNNFHWFRADGTAANPTNTKSGMTFMSHGMRGYDGTAPTSSAASFAAVATENFTNTGHGIKFVWQTTPNGGLTRTGIMEFTGDGKLTANGIGIWRNGISTTSTNISVGSGFGAVTSGYSNVMVGDTAGLSITSAHENVAVGHYAMWLHQSGFGNVAMGEAAMRANISGTYNTAIGYQALINNLNSNNTALGYRALAAAGGSGNVALGYDTGSNNLGSNNIFIGNGAGNTVSGTRSGNVIIGGLSGSTINTSNGLYLNNGIGTQMLSFNSTAIPTFQGLGTGYFKLASGVGSVSSTIPSTDITGTFSTYSIAATDKQIVFGNSGTGYQSPDFMWDYANSRFIVNGRGNFVNGASFGNDGTPSYDANNGGIDIFSGGLGLVGGADNNLSTRTNNTLKVFRIGTTHYVKGQLPLATLMATSTSTGGVVSVGGGSTATNAATQVKIYTAANNTTITGNEVARWDSVGKFGLGTTTPVSTIEAIGDGITIRSTKTASTVGNGNFYSGAYSGNRSALITQTNSAAANAVSYGGNNANGEPATQHIFFSWPTVGTITPGKEVLRMIGTRLVGIQNSIPTSNLSVAQHTDGPGTVSNSAGGTTVTGVNTVFLNTFIPGQTITINGETVAISAIASNTSMTTAAITNANSGVAYTLTGGSRLDVKGNGRVGIGTTTPTSMLQVVGLPVYADNTAATTGGLTVGAMYRTSTGQAMIVY